MANSPDFVTHALDLLSGVGAVQARAMFGGHGLYVDGLFVAIVAGEQLYLKADAASAQRFAAAGGQPFTYLRGGSPARLGFWTVPPEAMETPALMRDWGRLAMQAALTAATSKPKRRR